MSFFPLGFDVPTEQIQGYARALIDELKVHITNERIKLMSELHDELTGYKADVERQFQQIRDQFAPIIQGLQNDKVDAEARATAAVESLTALQTDVDANIQDIKGERSNLQADDPAPEPPVV